MPDLTTIDPTKVTNQQGLQEFLGSLRTAVVELKADTDGYRSQIGDLSTRLQKAVENAAPDALGTRELADAGERELGRRYVDDAGTLRMVRDVERFQYNGRTYERQAPGLLDDVVVCGPWHRDLRRAVSLRNLARLQQKRPHTPRLDAEVAHLLLRAPAAVRQPLERAFYNTSGSGADWIQEQWVPDLVLPFETPRRLAGLFDVQPTSSDTVKRPKLTTGVRPYKKSAISSDDPAKYTASTPATTSGTVDIEGLAVRVLVDENADEDAAELGARTIERLMVAAIDDGYEDCMVNGDSASTHQDAIASWNTRSRWGSSGLGGAADHRRTFLGLRAKAADDSKTADLSSTKTTAGLLTILALLAERAMSDVLYVMPPEIVVDLLDDSNLITVDKLGAQATILTGQIGALFGHPVVLSRFLTKDLAATGLYTGSGTTGGVLCVDRSAFQHYQRRGVVAEMDKEISSGHIELVVTLRRVLGTMISSGEYPVAWGYNWS